MVVVRWWCGGGAVVVRWWCGGGAVVVRWWCGGGVVVVPDGGEGLEGAACKEIKSGAWLGRHNLRRSSETIRSMCTLFQVPRY